ncbi:hypothetical protein [Pseudomonas putida]|nr:hypothetical protein [Pseudomonas putida]
MKNRIRAIQIGLLVLLAAGILVALLARKEPLVTPTPRQHSEQPSTR